MTTPQYPDPHQQPDPSAYQPPAGGYQPPDPSAYQPPSGGYQQPNVEPQPGQPGAYPPPGQPGAYPPPGQGAYPPPDPGSYPPPGQPGGSYPPPPPGGPAAPGTPGQEPSKPSNTPRIILAVAVVAVVVLGIILYLVNRQSDPDYAEVGDCIQFNSETDVSVVDCTSDEAQYKVQKRIDGTSSMSACDQVADSDVSLYTKGDGDQYTLCVSLVLEKGDCVSGAGDIVDCAEPTAQYQVISVLTDTTDDTNCPDETALSRAYQADKQVVCLRPAT